MNESIRNLAEKLADVEKRFPSPGNLVQAKKGGVLITKCSYCGEAVALVGEGVPRRVCSSCGKEHHETIYG